MRSFSHECPDKILSDQESHFKNRMVEQLVQKFEIKHLFSTPYHPQTNGLVERFNRTLCESLAKLTQKSEEWDLYINPVLLAYRSSKHSTTKVTPFLLTYGREAVLPVDGDTKEKPQDVLFTKYVSIIEDLPQIQQTTLLRIQDQQVKQKDYHDKHIHASILFAIGDKVLMYDAKKDRQWSEKLEDKWNGPFYIHMVGPN